MIYWTHINIHHSADETSAREIRNDHIRRGWSDIGYHFIIERDELGARVVPGRPLTRIGAHNSHQDWNKKAIGICVVGKLHERLITPSQWHTLLVLVARLCQSWRIQPENILGHRETGARTLCPGTLVDDGLFSMAHKSYTLDGLRRILERGVAYI